MTSVSGSVTSLTHQIIEVRKLNFQTRYATRPTITSCVQNHQCSAMAGRRSTKTPVLQRLRLHHVRDGNQQIADDDERLVAGVESEQAHLLLVRVGFEHGMSELPHEERRQAEAHGGRQIEGQDGVAVEEHARADEMQHLVAEVVVRRMMVVLLPQHDFGVERLHRRRDQASEHLSQQAHSHTSSPFADSAPQLNHHPSCII